MNVRELCQNMFLILLKKSDNFVIEIYIFTLVLL